MSRRTPPAGGADHDGSTVYREGYASPQLVTVDAAGNEVSRTADQGMVQSWLGNTNRHGSTSSIEWTSDLRTNSFGGWPTLD